jgi:hypothetical protein
MSARQPAHTPYDGSSKLFTIGLKPLDPDTWIEIDEYLLPYLAEKRRLYAEIPDKVFVEEPDTRDAQREVLDLLGAHLLQKYPETYRRSGAGIELVEAAGIIAGRDNAAAFGDAPLVAASLLVQEDLILMRKDQNGWRLVAGSLCFPSSWALIEKFGKPLQEIHAPVPGFGPGSRPADLINRMFDGLQGQAVERYNWSIQSGDDLYHPLSDIQRIDRATNRPSRFCRRRHRCSCLHSRRAADTQETAGVARYPVHHPHSSRPVAGAGAPSRPGSARRLFRRAIGRPRRSTARLQGHDRGPRRAGRSAASHG